MADRVLLTQFSKQLNRNAVLRQLSGTPDCSVWDELLACYTQLEPCFWNAAAPKAVIAFSKASKLLEGPFLKAGDAVAYVMITLGDSVERIAKQYFDDKDYLSAMVLHAMADTYLFGLEEELLETLSSACKSRGLGAERRLEAPIHLPMEAQWIAAQETDAFHLLGVTVTEGGMLCPVKSYWFLIKLTKDGTDFCVRHDCTECTNLNCPNRSLNN